MSTVAERKLAIQTDWLKPEVPAVNAKLSDGTDVYVPSHFIQVAHGYPTFEDGELVTSMTQAQVAGFLREYNRANNTSFRYPMLFEDEAVRDQLGKNHAIFDENFQRNDKPWRWGYVADYNKPYGQMQDGIGQQLVTRLVGWRLPEGDYEIGPVTIAPSGIVPWLSRNQLEKMVGADGLKRLEQLRGKEIYEKGDQVVDVRNQLGYPQFTLGHDVTNESGLIPHNNHVYTPNQDEPERVGVRGADWYHHGGRGCFDVSLDVGPAGSSSGRSFPLVRGGDLEAEITGPSYKIKL